MLFQIDLTGVSPQDVFREFWSDHAVPSEIRGFAEELVLGVHAERRELDRWIIGSAEHWRIERMAVVDRNVLRMAVHELVHDPDTPDAVIIDEAIEVAKKYGSEESGSFVNGVLDAIRKRKERGEVGPDPAERNG
jgi:N utilization substance protein B